MALNNIALPHIAFLHIAPTFASCDSTHNGIVTMCTSLQLQLHSQLLKQQLQKRSQLLLSATIAASVSELLLHQLQQ